MATFASLEDLENVHGTFLRQIVVDPAVGGQLAAAGTSFLLHYTDPDCDILIDCTVDPPTVTIAPELTGDGQIQVWLSADDGHLLWLGELNMTTAMAQRRIKAKGPIVKMVRLLPSMRPAFPKYREYLRANGHLDRLSPPAVDR